MAGDWKCVCEELRHSPLATAGEVGELEGLLPVLREMGRQLLNKGVYRGCTARLSAAFRHQALDLQFGCALGF